MKQHFRVALAGNPNCGKTCIFNALTGARQHVGNYPGVTVESKSGKFTLNGMEIELIDLPGVYSLSSSSPEEDVVFQELTKPGIDLIIDVVDSSIPRRSLYLTTQLAELHIPMVLAFNMSDDARRKGFKFDIPKLEKYFGSPIAQTVGSKIGGVKPLLDLLAKTLTELDDHGVPMLTYGEDIDDAIKAVADKIDSLKVEKYAHIPSRFFAIKLLEHDTAAMRIEEFKPAMDEVEAQIAHLWEKHAIEADTFMADRRYAMLAGACRDAISMTQERRREISDKIDAVMTNKYLGLPLFFLIIYLTFWFTFTLADPLMGIIEDDIFGNLNDAVKAAWNPETLPFLRSLLTDGVISGVGGVLNCGCPICAAHYAAEGVDLRVRVLGDAPVGADHALEAVLLPQQVPDQVFAVGVAHVFAVLLVQPPGHRVIGHHGGGAAGGAVQPEGRLGEGLHVLAGVVAGIHRVFPEGVVGVAPALAGAAAGPVLHHGVHAVPAPAVGAVLGGLHAVAVGLHQRLHVLGHHAQRVPEAHPAGLGAQVDLRAQRRGDAHGAILPGGVPGELARHLRVEAGREADALRPLADVAARGLELRRRGLRAAAGVGGDVHRYGQGQRLRPALQRVAPAGGGARVVHGHHQYVADVVSLQEALLLVGQGVLLPAGCLPGRAVKGAGEGTALPGRHHLVGGIQHQARDLLDAHPRGQVLRPRLGGQPPVGVGRQRPGARQILEAVAVHLQYADAGVLVPGQRRSARLGQPAQPVRLGYDLRVVHVPVLLAVLFSDTS